jgi:outer membrane protein OmpA-like peptidoglycan-associated protein
MKNIIFAIFIGISAIGFTQEKYKVADNYFQNMQYLEAAKEFETAIFNGDKSKEILEKIGNAYYFNTNMQSANKWYSKLIAEYRTEINSEYFFRYAKSFEGIGKYKQARRWMKVFDDEKQKNFKNLSIERQNNLNYLFEQEENFRLNNLSINTVFSDFGPMYYNNLLIYASAKDSSYYKRNEYYSNQPLFFNLFVGEINNKEEDVTTISEFSKVLNSKYNEATLCFSNDFKKIYYTRNSYNGNGSDMSKSGVNRLKIYTATLIEGNDGKKDWGNIKELPFNSEEYSVGHPSLNKEGTKLYFVSDMPGTIGKTDIFVVDILEEDVYSKPKNLGTKINTAGREMFPFLTENKLYFSSDGHQSIGGLDVFESSFSTYFESPVNLGVPLNSVLDDFSFIINEEENNGFVCSNRNSGKGDDDIYYFEKISAKLCKQTVNGYISNNLTGERISNVTVVLYDNNGNRLEETQTEINGNYNFNIKLDCNTDYKIEVSKKGFRSVEKPVITNKKIGETIVPIGLDKLSELIVEENGLLKINVGVIYFDLDKSDIRKDAAREFDKVVSLLNQYPNMIIKIESHTDSRGRDNYNLALSDKRAKATRDYIISKGINPSRIISAIGFGETQLMNKCENGVPCSDSLHQLNRRSEFIIIKI